MQAHPAPGGGQGIAEGIEERCLPAVSSHSRKTERVMALFIRALVPLWGPHTHDLI